LIIRLASASLSLPQAVFRCGLATLAPRSTTKLEADAGTTDFFSFRRLPDLQRQLRATGKMSYFLQRLD